MTLFSGLLYCSFEVGPIATSASLAYTIPLTSARYQPGQEAAPNTLGSRSGFTTSSHPNTGNKIEGWKWDERIWPSETAENYVNTLPKILNPSTSGLDSSYFQSGIGTDPDLELQNIVNIPYSGLLALSHRKNTWTPEINHGYYYDFDDQYYLYSDDSEIQYPTYSGIVLGIGYAPSSGFNLLEINDVLKPGIPVTAIQYQWNNVENKYSIFSISKKKVKFTGLLDEDNNELETFDNKRQTIIWDNVDQTNPEFLISFSGLTVSGHPYPNVVFNKQHSSLVGTGIIPSGIEVVGYSNGSQGQVFHLEYAPIDSTMGFSVYSYIVSSGTVTSWTPVPMDTITLSGYQVKVDYDLGLLQFGDSVNSGLVPVAGETITAQYWKTYKLEYEIKNTKDSIFGHNANINPIFKHDTKGFIFLQTYEQIPSYIVLEANGVEEIISNVYGPLYIGNSYLPVIATVYDEQDNPIEDIEVTISITSDPAIGNIGLSDSVVSITDGQGQARAFYTPPKSINDIGEYVTATYFSIDNSPTYPGVLQTTTLQTNNLLIEGNTEDIFVYQVYTDDYILGFYDPSVSSTSDVQTNEYYRRYFEGEDIWGPTGLKNVVSGLSTNAVSWEYNHRLVWDFNRPSLFNTTNDGRKVLVSQFSTSYLDPHTFSFGSIGPTQPIDIVSVGNGQYNLIFDTSIYSLPYPIASDIVPSGTLHSYYVIAPTSVKLQASAYNQQTNQTITSNEIQIKLAIPSYLNGLWIIDAINDTHIDEISSLLSSITASGQKVPLGFRLRSSNVTLAAALDGVTFLDINQEFNSNVYDTEEVTPLRCEFNINLII